MGDTPTQLRHSVIVNKHLGQVWNFTNNIHSEKWIIKRYLECVCGSNNVYKMKADVGMIYK